MRQRKFMFARKPELAKKWAAKYKAKKSKGYSMDVVKMAKNAKGGVK